jgi:hypothetical protein
MPRVCSRCPCTYSIGEGSSRRRDTVIASSSNAERNTASAFTSISSRREAGCLSRRMRLVLENPYQVIAIALWLATTGCGGSNAPRLATTRDSVVHYGAEFAAMPVTLRGETGGLRRVNDAMTSITPAAVASVRHDSIRCTNTGSATVSVQLRSEQVSFVLECRIRSRLRLPAFSELTLRDSARPFLIIDDSEPEAPDTIREFNVSVSDSGIVRFVAGALVPVGVGRTALRILLRGASFPGTVTVTERVADDAVSLAPGDLRSWKLTAGRYSIVVGGDALSGASPRFRMVTAGLRCTRDPRRDDTIHCLAADSGKVHVVNDTERIGVRRAMGTVRITRVP